MHVWNLAFGILVSPPLRIRCLSMKIWRCGIFPSTRRSIECTMRIQPSVMRIYTTLTMYSICLDRWTVIGPLILNVHNFKQLFLFVSRFCVLAILFLFSSTSALLLSLFNDLTGEHFFTPYLSEMTCP